MAVYGGVSASDISGTVVSLGKSLRDVLRRADEVQQYLAGLALTDLEGLGIAAADAQDLKSAAADMAGLAALFTTGTDSRNPGAGYVYGASVRTIVGPL